jgi:hypothetical protein
MRLGAVTMDLDGLPEYHRIHGLPPPDGDVILSRALPRFLNLCATLRIKATLFAIGRTLEDPAVARMLAAAHGDGHEVASHSFGHDYRMSQFTRAGMRADLMEAREAITRVTGEPPVGFRAPGYNTNAELMTAVAETGHTYDSSVFPSLPYFAARAGAILTYAAQGSRSQSLLGDWRQFAGPRKPYRPDATVVFKPVKPGARGLPLWQYPMAVATPVGLPMIGTFVPLYPAALRKALGFLSTRMGGTFNLELHAIDFSDPSDGFHPLLKEAQPGLTQPLQERTAALTDLMRAMVDRLDVCRLKDWAGHLG